MANSALYDERSPLPGAQMYCHPPRHSGALVLVDGSRRDASPAMGKEVPVQPSPSDGNQVLLAVDDVRQLVLRDIFVGQSKAKTVDDMWARVCEADRRNTEHLRRCQQLELEMWRVKADFTNCQAARQAEHSERESLERSISDRDDVIVGLRNQLSSCQDANRDLTDCTARLTRAVWDLTGADDADVAAENVKIRYDEQELDCARMKRQVASMDSEKSQLEEEVWQWMEKYALLCAESKNETVQKDQIIHTLRSCLYTSGLCPPA